MNKKDKLIADVILTTASDRGAEKSTCPSEIARMLFAPDWRKHMAEVRAVAIGLAEQGKVRITQKGLPVDLGAIKGPIRIVIN